MNPAHPNSAPASPEPHASASGNAILKGSADYSRFVKAARVFLPVSAGALLLVIVLYSMMNKPLSDVISPNILKSLAGQLEMMNPTLTYTDDNNRAYFVSAERARQTPADKDRWQLFKISGRMKPPTGFGYRLISDTGRLDSAKKLLDLAGAVRVISDQGYVFDARSAHVDMNANRVVSEEPVRAQGGATTITSDRFELWDKGAQFRFEGRVHFVSEAAPKTVVQAKPGKP